MKNSTSDLIIEALKPLNLPVADSVYYGEENEYCTFSVYSERPELSADDEVLYELGYAYIHYFTKGNPNTTKKQIKNFLRKAGFGVTNIESFFENDSGYYHIVFDVCTILYS